MYNATNSRQKVPSTLTTWSVFPSAQSFHRWEAQDLEGSGDAGPAPCPPGHPHTQGLFSELLPRSLRDSGADSVGLSARKKRILPGELAMEARRVLVMITLDPGRETLPRH